MKNESKPKFELKSHSSQIADTGDYDGEYEITNGKVSLFTKDGDDEALQVIVDALNDSGADFYLDDSEKIELYYLKSDPLIAQANAMYKEMALFVSDFEGDYVMDDGTIVDKPSAILVRAYERFKPILSAARGETVNQPQG